MKKLLLFCLAVSLHAQQGAGANPSVFAGLVDAWAYAYGVNPAVQPLTVDSAITPTQLRLHIGTIALSSGVQFMPFSTNAPIIIGSGATQEIVTPTVVNCKPLNCSITAPFVYSHGQGDTIRSGTVGLQEAINAAAAHGGSAVLSGLWALNGGTTTIYNAAVVPGNVVVVDNRTGLTLPGGSVALQTAVQGTGAKNVLRDLPSLNDFAGVDPTGATDSSAAINTAAAAAHTGGYSLSCPSNATYLVVAQTISLPSGVSLQGTCTFINTGSTAGAMLNLSGNNTLDGAIIKQVSTVPVVFNIAANATNTIITHTKVTAGNSTSHAICLNVQALGISSLQAIGNNWDSCDYGVFTQQSAYDFVNLLVQGNTFTNLYADGVELDDETLASGRPATQTGKNWTVAFNSMSWSPSITLNANSGYGVAVSSNSAGEIIGNQFISACPNECVHIEQQPSYINIDGNFAYFGTGSTGAWDHSCIDLLDVANADVVNNHLFNCATHGILAPTAHAAIGPIYSGTVGAGGTGYTNGDVLTVVQSGASLGTFTATVGAGIVTAITPLAGGYKYTVANGLATTGGTGMNATINVTALQSTQATHFNLAKNLIISPAGDGIFVAGGTNQTYADGNIQDNIIYGALGTAVASGSSTTGASISIHSHPDSLLVSGNKSIGSLYCLDFSGIQQFSRDLKVNNNSCRLSQTADFNDVTGTSSYVVVNDYTQTVDNLSAANNASTTAQNFSLGALARGMLTIEARSATGNAMSQSFDVVYDGTTMTFNALSSSAYTAGIGSINALTQSGSNVQYSVYNGAGAAATTYSIEARFTGTMLRGSGGTITNATISTLPSNQAVPNWNLNRSNLFSNFKFTLSGQNVTGQALIGEATGQRINLQLCYGAFTFAYNSTFKNGGAFPTSAQTCGFQQFFFDGTSNWAQTPMSYEDGSINPVGGTINGPMTYSQITALSSPVAGRLIYCSDCKNFTDDTTGTFDSAIASGGHGTNALYENGSWRVH